MESQGCEKHVPLPSLCTEWTFYFQHLTLKLGKRYELGWKNLWTNFLQSLKKSFKYMIKIMIGITVIKDKND